MAMIVMLATVTFGSSLATLVSHPALYGWNWTYALASGTPTYIPRTRAAALLDHDPAVAAWTGVYYGTFKIDGLTVPVIGQSPRAAGRAAGAVRSRAAGRGSDRARACHPGRAA